MEVSKSPEYVNIQRVCSSSILIFKAISFVAAPSTRAEQLDGVHFFVMKSPHLRLRTLCVCFNVCTHVLSPPSLLHTHIYPQKNTQRLRYYTETHTVWRRAWAPHSMLDMSPPKVHLDSHEVSGSSWAFSDVGNYAVSRQCLVKDREMHVLLRLRSAERTGLEETALSFSWWRGGKRKGWGPD